MPQTCPPGKQWQRTREQAECSAGLQWSGGHSTRLCFVPGLWRGADLCPFSCATKALPPLHLLTGEAWLQGLLGERSHHSGHAPRAHKTWAMSPRCPHDKHSHESPDGHDIGGKLASAGELDLVGTGVRGYSVRGLRQD